jgi:hypothetical protein
MSAPPGTRFYGRVSSLQALKNATDRRQSVGCPSSRCFRGPIPASFILHQQGAMILQLLDAGLYLYHPPKARKAK